MSMSHGSFISSINEILKPRAQAAAASADAASARSSTTKAPDEFFGRLFDEEAKQPEKSELQTLADSMEEASDDASGNSTIAVGMTFLGQFIDHDLTLDTMTKLGTRPKDDERVPNFRTPRLELDSVYRGGPGIQRHLYDRNYHLVAGTNANAGDLPRNNAGVALIGDHRNDENMFISQLHGLFLRLHNRVLDDMTGGPGKEATKEQFQEAQKQVRHVYQSIVVEDYLPAIVDKSVLDPLIAGFWNGTLPTTPQDWTGAPDMPFEFSAAAFRFGHSQVRSGYRINATKQAGLFDIGGFQAVKADSNVDWNLFFDFGDGQVQFARQIDTSIAKPLFKMPRRVNDDEGESLPFRNLERGQHTFRLPFGEDIADKWGIAPIDRHDKVKDAKLDRTPLWFYVLAEAEQNNGLLGSVGGNLVAGTILNLLLRDTGSIAHQPNKVAVSGLSTLTMSSVAKLVS